MKNLLTLLFAVLALNLFAQDCPTTPIVISTQSQIDSFQVLYPDCNFIKNSFLVQWTDGGTADFSSMTNVDSIWGQVFFRGNMSNVIGLPNLKHLQEILIFEQPLDLVSISGFSNLESANGLAFSGCRLLETISGFEKVSTIGINGLEFSDCEVLQALPDMPLLETIGGTFTLQNSIFVENFNPISNLKKIEGHFNFNDMLAQQPFEGLEQLDSIKGIFAVFTNGLTNFKGLTSLKFIGQSFKLEDCYDLTDFSGLSNLNYIGNKFWIIRCSSIGSFLGLENLEKIESDFILEDSSPTSFSGLTDLNSIGGNFNIYLNSSLESFEGLENLTHIKGNLDVTSNEFLINFFGLNSLDTIGTDFIFHDNYNCLGFDGLESLKHIGNAFDILNNGSFKDFTGLENLTTIGGHFFIISEFGLETTAGLQSLQSIGDSFEINSSESLYALEDLENLVFGSLNFLAFNFNTELAICNVDFLCNYLSNPDDWPDLNIELEGNAPGCNTLEEIYVSCDPNRCIPQEIFLNNQDEVDNFIIEYPTCTEVFGNLSITDRNGPVSNLTGLKNIETVRGYVAIGSAELDNLQGLENLEIIHRGLDLSLENATSFEGLENLKEVDGLFIYQNSQITDLQGLNGLEKIGSEGLDINFNGSLTSLEGLDNLQEIEEGIRIQDNYELLDLDGFPSLTSVDYLDLNNDFTNISGLNALEIINSDAYILSNLTALEGLQSLKKVGGDLIFGVVGIFPTDPITFTGLSSLDTIAGSLTFGEVLSNSFDGFNNLKHIGGNYNEDFIGFLDVAEFNGFNSLQSVGGNFNIAEAFNLTDLNAFSSLQTVGGNFYIGNMQSLLSVDNFSNMRRVGNAFHLEFLESIENIDAFAQMDFTAPSEVILSGNFNLSACSNTFLCNYIANGGDVLIVDNAPGCADEIEVQDNCTNQSNFAKIRYATFYDINQDGFRQIDEPINADISTNLAPLGYTLLTNPDSLGRIILPYGDYTLSPNISADWVSTNSNSFDIQLDSLTDCDTLLFGIFPANVVSEMSTNIGSLPTRCNEFIPFDLSAKNEGNSITNGWLWLEVDTNIADVNFVQMPDDSSMPNRYGWQFDNLFPGGSFRVAINLQIPGPTDFPIGERLQFKSWTEYEDTNGPQMSDEFVYDPEVRCSYDPNDKLVSPSRTMNYTQFDESLIYTIRFQNTGNDVAFDVVIKDEIDPLLDLSTFQVLGSSHYEHLNTLIENREITFEFKDIFLPDSTSDLEGSNGYVMFQINAIGGLSEFTPIENTADIFFDKNPPVITNTTQNSMVSSIIDSDGDGFLEIVDCDDENAAVNPLAPEIPNNDIDENCDGLVLIIDDDMDGYNSDDDCDDTNPNINPGATEIPDNGIDEDCDGMDATSDVDDVFAQSIKVFPNPTEGVITLSGNNLAKAKITITSLTGKILLSENLRANQQIHLPKGEKGMLILKVETEEGVAVKRIIKL